MKVKEVVCPCCNKRTVIPSNPIYYSMEIANRDEGEACFHCIQCGRLLSVTAIFEVKKAHIFPTTNV